MLSPIPCFFAGFFLSSLPLQLLPSKHGQLTLLTPPFSFSSRSFLPLQDFPSLHFPVPNSSKTPSHRFSQASLHSMQPANPSNFPSLFPLQTSPFRLPYSFPLRENTPPLFFLSKKIPFSTLPFFVFKK